MMKRFIVVSCEHTVSFDSPVLLSGQFDTLEEAEAHVKKCVTESVIEFPDETAVEDDLVQTFDASEHPTYGCVWNILDLMKP